MGKPWLTEAEIGDLLEKDLYGYFGTFPWCENHVFLREPKLGTIRPDFMGLSIIDGGLNVEIIELKITADATSVSQLAKYRNFWLDQFDHYRQFKMPNRASKKGFEISLTLVARFFDAAVYPLAKALQINLMRVEIKSKTEITLEYESDGDRFQYDPILNNLLLKNFKDEEHGEAVH